MDEIITETAIVIENNEEKIDQIIVTKSDHPIQPHNGKRIKQKVVVSQDMSYAVTYSEEDNSVHGWLVNIELNGQQQPDVYFKLDKFYDIREFVLDKNILLFCYFRDEKYRKYLKHMFKRKNYLPNW